MAHTITGREDGGLSRKKEEGTQTRSHFGKVANLCVLSSSYLSKTFMHHYFI